MFQLKKAWVTQHGRDVAMLSLESKDPKLVLGVQQSSFPDEPTPENPLRKVTAIGLFDNDDLLLIAKTCLDHVYGEEDYDILTR